MPPSPVPPQQPPGQERPATVLDTDHDIRQAPPANPPARPAVSPHAPSPKQPHPPQPSAASPYRPTLRPPTMLLTVLDDGKGDGEVLRLRAERFVIGRSEGD